MWLNLNEVLELLGVAKSTFMEWRARGEAPPAKKLPNGRLRFRRDDVEAWLDGLPDAA